MEAGNHSMNDQQCKEPQMHKNCHCGVRQPARTSAKAVDTLHHEGAEHHSSLRDKTAGAEQSIVTDAQEEPLILVSPLELNAAMAHSSTACNGIRPKRRNAIVIPQPLRQDEKPQLRTPLEDALNSQSTKMEKFFAQKNRIQTNRRRCWTCHAKVGLTAVMCRCDYTFCSKHRYPEEHGCSFNYKKAAKRKLEDENPRIVPMKVIKIN